VKTVLLVSGLDPSGGAGFLADARVCAEHGVRAVGVVTALTVQDTRGVRAVDVVAPERIAEQLVTLLSDVEVDAVKVGMLGDAEVLARVAAALAQTRAPLVWDPVLWPSRGGVPLFRGDPRPFLAEARVVTPNLAEAGALLGGPVPADVPAMRAAARELCARGARAALVTGGHLDGPRAVDVLAEGDAIVELDGPRADAGPLHGTGCVLSAALACGLAGGAPLSDAARRAKQYLTEKLRAPLTVGQGARVLV